MIQGTVMEDFNLYNETYSSFKAETREEQVKLFNMMNAKADKRLVDCKGSVIAVKDVVCSKRTAVNEKTGELECFIALRLVDENGTSYSTGSVGVMNSLKQAFKMFGEPTWDTPVKFEVVETSTRRGTTSITLKAVG